LEKDCSLCAQRQRDKPALAPDHVELVAVCDNEICLDAERSRGRSIHAEPVCVGACLGDRTVGDLDLTEDRAGGGTGLDLSVCTGNDDDLVVAGLVHEDQREPRRSIYLTNGTGLVSSGRESGAHTLWRMVRRSTTRKLQRPTMVSGQALRHSARMQDLTPRLLGIGRATALAHAGARSSSRFH
jgi:hypothetical protein